MVCCVSSGYKILGALKGFVMAVKYDYQLCNSARALTVHPDRKETVWNRIRCKLNSEGYGIACNG